MHDFIREKRREHAQQAQQAANLMLTREVIACIRLARTLIFPPEMHTELFLLAQATARFEWGSETVVDDFSIPGKFLIKRDRLEEEL